MKTINKYSQMYLYAKGWFDSQVAHYGKHNTEMFIVSNYSGIYPEDATDNNFFSILRDAVYDYLKNQTENQKQYTLELDSGRCIDILTFQEWVDRALNSKEISIKALVKESK